MTPRARRRWLIALPVLGLPLLLLAALLWYLGSGRAIADIQRQWSENLPGSLAIAELQLEGVDTLSLRGVEWQDNDQSLFSLGQITVTGSILGGNLHSIVLDQPHLRIDDAGFASWRDLLSRMMVLVDRDKQDRDTATPLVMIRNGQIAIGAWQLQQVNLNMTHLEKGSLQVQLTAQQGDQPWQVTGVILADGSFELRELGIALQARQLFAAIMGLDPAWAESAALAAEVPEGLQFAAEKASFHLDGSWQANLAIDLAQPWWGLHQISIAGSQDSAVLEMLLGLHHRDGVSSLRLRDVDSAQELVVEGQPLPLRDMLGSRWPSAQPAPEAIDMAASALRRDAAGQISGALRVGFVKPWLGLQRLTIDEVVWDDPWNELLASQERQFAFRLGVDSGHPHPLRLLFSGSQLRSTYTTEVKSSLRLRGAEGPVSSATILAVPQALGLLDDMPLPARAMIPQQLSLAGTDIVASMPDVRGQIGIRWDSGHLTSGIDGAVIDWRFAPLSFSHALLGNLLGELRVNATWMNLRWSEFKPARTALTALTFATGLPSTTPAAVDEMLGVLPQGEIAIFPAQFPSDTKVRLHAGDDRRFTQLTIGNDAHWLLQAQQLPISVVSTLFPQVAVDGEINAARVVFRDDGQGPWPQSLEARVENAAGSWLGWGGISESINTKATFSRDKAGELWPETATVALHRLTGSRDGYQAAIPGLTISLQREALQRWRNELRFEGVAGHLSAVLTSKQWASALPENGVFTANAFDIASALRSVSLRDAEGIPRSLMIPEDLSARLSGTIQATEADDIFRFQLNEGKLHAVNWLPWVEEADLDLNGASTVQKGVLSTRLSGAVQAGQFNILGHMIAVEPGQLAYGVALNQDPMGLQVSDLFFAVQKPDAAADAVPQSGSAATSETPLVHISGQVDRQGISALRAVVDEVDVGWLTTLPDIGMPPRLHMDGRARAIIDLSFDGQETLRSEGILMPVGVEVSLDGGRLEIENLTGMVKLLPRAWQLRNGGIHPLPEPGSDGEQAPESQPATKESSP